MMKDDLRDVVRRYGVRRWRLRAELHSDERTSQVLWREGLALATGRHGDRGEGAHDGRGVPDGLFQLGDGVLGNLVDGCLREQGHHGTVVALGVDDGGGLGARVGGAGRVGECYGGEGVRAGVDEKEDGYLYIPESTARLSSSSETLPMSLSEEGPGAGRSLVAQGDRSKSRERGRSTMARSKDQAASRFWCSLSKGPLNLEGGTSWRR